MDSGTHATRRDLTSYNNDPDGDLLLNLQYGLFLRLLIDAGDGHILLEDADRYSTKCPRESSVSKIDKLQL